MTVFGFEMEGESTFLCYALQLQYDVWDVGLTMSNDKMTLQIIYYSIQEYMLNKVGLSVETMKVIKTDTHTHTQTLKNDILYSLNLNTLTLTYTDASIDDVTNII